MSKSSVMNVLLEAKTCLELASAENPSLQGVLDFIQSMDLSDGALNDVAGCVPAHAGLLDRAISSMSDTRMPKLKSALAAAKHHLHWRVDDGGYYAEGADVGDGYKTGNMHALLVGPKNSLIVADDILLGFFLLAPNTLYRDHKHSAPEVYMPLTGPSGWRFGLGDWEDHDAGSVICNAPGIVHATRVYEVPFLSLFAWTRDIGSHCEVVFARDWEEIETTLHKS